MTKATPSSFDERGISLKHMKRCKILHLFSISFLPVSLKSDVSEGATFPAHFCIMSLSCEWISSISVSVSIFSVFVDCFQSFFCLSIRTRANSTIVPNTKRRDDNIKYPNVFRFDPEGLPAYEMQTLIITKINLIDHICLNITNFLQFL